MCDGRRAENNREILFGNRVWGRARMLAFLLVAAQDAKPPRRGRPRAPRAGDNAPPTQTEKTHQMTALGPNSDQTEVLSGHSTTMCPSTFVHSFSLVTTLASEAFSVVSFALPPKQHAKFSARQRNRRTSADEKAHSRTSPTRKLVIK